MAEIIIQKHWAWLEYFWLMPGDYESVQLKPMASASRDLYRPISQSVGWVRIAMKLASCGTPENFSAGNNLFPSTGSHLHSYKVSVGLAEFLGGKKAVDVNAELNEWMAEIYQVMDLI